MSRQEHLDWAKQRALAYLPQSPMHAINSMLSDLSKHPELEKHPGGQIAPLFYGVQYDVPAVKRWIEGFQ